MHVTSTWKQYLLSLCLLAVLVSTVQYTSASHCSLNFEWTRLGYGFLSIILVLEKCSLGPWASLKSAWILYFEYAMNPVRFLSFLQIHIVSLMNLPVLSVSIALTLSQSFACFHYRYDPVCSFEDWYVSWKVLKSLVIFRPVIFCSVSRSCIVLEKHLSHGIYGVVLWSKVLNFTALVGV